MVQRKLTNDELQKVMTARHDIRAMCNWCETDRGYEYWHGVAKQLHLMALHATTDGKPWVDPESPIPDGYRLAVAGDEGRSDCKIWRGKERGYIPRWNDKSAASYCEFQPNETYIVPIDRVPTDDDAKSRPEVMVRDRDQQDWKKVRLIAVQSEGNQPFVTMGRSSLVTFWRQCRHLYLGE